MTERAKKLLLLYYKQSRKIRRVSGLPPLTFKAKKAGTLKNYRIYGNTETKTRSYSGAAPLSFPIEDGAVSNYRVYGQTSRNLFDENLYNKNVEDNTIIYVPMYVGNVDYVTCSTTCPRQRDSSFPESLNSRYIFILSGNVNTGALNIENGVSNEETRTIQPTNGYVTIAYRKIESHNARPWEYQTMLNVGSTALPYEPYGESVGDRTGNILPMSTTPIDTIIDDFHCEYDGMGTIKLTALTNNAVLSGFTVPLSKDFTIPISVGQGGTGCLQINNDAAYINVGGVASFTLNLNENTYTRDFWRLYEINRIHSNYTSMGGANINAVQIQTSPDAVTNIQSGQTLTIRPAFVENVTEQVPFEPYGYKIPVTNNSETANIYLDEPLRKVGDEAEYVDYATQKWHRVRKNLLQNTATSKTINGVTFTVNNDGSVTCNGTASVTTYFDLNENFNSTLYAGMEASFYQSGQQPSINAFRMRISKANRVSIQDFTMNDQVITDNGDSLLLAIRIQSGYTCDNLTFYPMIRKADITDGTYEPYIENTEVDVTIPDLPAQSSSNFLSVGTAVQPSSVAVDVDEVVSCGDKVTDSQSVNYGKYKIPVTITAGSAETTNIYLDEPLAKSGNNADYIDYMAQKRHNSDGTESSVTLPEISVTAGTNTLTVGTDVQPSSVEIKGRIKAAGGD